MGEMTFGEKLLATRKLCRLSRQDVADRTELSKRSICRYELEGVTPIPLHKRIIEKQMFDWIMEAASER